MGVGGRGIGYLVGCPTPTDRSDPMPEQFDPHNAMAAFDHDSTLVVALALSGRSWQAEAVARRPRRERERLVGERLQLENRIENLLCLHGVVGFRPRLKKAAERLDELRSLAGMPLPGKTMAELRRLMVRHRLLGEQLREIEAERDRVATATHPDRAERMIQHLAQIVGLGLET